MKRLQAQTDTALARAQREANNARAHLAQAQQSAAYAEHVNATATAAGQDRVRLQQALDDAERRAHAAEFRLADVESHAAQQRVDAHGIKYLQTPDLRRLPELATASDIVATAPSYGLHASPRRGW